jgi:hypothetical protein
MKLVFTALMLLSSGSIALEAQAIDKIIGGSAVARGRWPAVVAVAAGKELCTGTMIAPDLVLTAAHCFRTANADELVRVHFGERINSTVIDSAEWAVHPDFCEQPSCAGEELDFAYVRVPMPEEGVHDYVRPLSAEADVRARVFVGAPTTLVGFGVLSPDAPGLHGGIKRELVATLGSVSLPEASFVTEGAQGKDTCLGDSGGPALLRVGGEWRVAGILSRGSFPCGRGGTYRPTAGATDWLEAEAGYRSDDYEPVIGAEFPRRASNTPEQLACRQSPRSKAPGGALVTLGLGALAYRRRNTKSGRCDG